MAMSLKSNILPSDNLNERLENTTTTTTTLGYRRKHGLEINTKDTTPAPVPAPSSSKTNAFFHTADIPTPRPPPSLSRKISLKQPTNETSSPSPLIMMIPTPSSYIQDDEQEDNQEIYHQNSYATRLRNLVASTRQGGAPSSIPHYLNTSSCSLSKKSSVAVDSPLTASPRSSFEDQHVIIDAIESLPTPYPGTTSSSQQQRHFVFPPSSTNNDNNNNIIPVLTATDILRPSSSNEIPKLADNLNLGDHQVIVKMKREHASCTAAAAVKPMTTEQQHEDLLGKQVGKYRISKLLGVGAFSHVYLAHHVDTQELFAIKSIQKGKLLDDPRVRSSIEREVGVLMFIDHPNIVHLEATMETEKSMCIVLEYVRGGELFDFVQKMHQPLPMTDGCCQIDEMAVKNVFLQLLRAVKWLHEHNIVHRDLKLENILIHRTQDGQHVLKITDFGLARVVDPDSPLLTTRCGSEEYAAPEIIQQSKQEGYDGRKTDTWSLGVILYALLVGYLPFRYDPRKHERVSQLFYRIVRAQVKWPTDIVISQEAKEVVQRILERKPEKRIPIDQIEDLHWFRT